MPSRFKLSIVNSYLFTDAGNSCYKLYIAKSCYLTETGTVVFTFVAKTKQSIVILIIIFNL
jgi:hypothetical protein